MEPADVYLLLLFLSFFFRIFSLWCLSDDLLRALGTQSVYVLKQGGLFFDDAVAAAAL